MFPKVLIGRPGNKKGPSWKLLFPGREPGKGFGREFQLRFPGGRDCSLGKGGLEKQQEEVPPPGNFNPLGGAGKRDGLPRFRGDNKPEG